MAWTDPNTYIAGAILTAAQMNAMQANLLAGGPIYATEAARNTAIPSPFEGQRAYITGSTVAAATGTNAAVPTGIQTVYNGAAWVCTTPVGAYSNTVGTLAFAAGAFVTTLTGDATAITATLATGTTALISMSADGFNSAAGNGFQIAVSVSGATTLAAGLNQGVIISAPAGSFYVTPARTMILTGLTAGNNTFLLNYATGTGGTNTYTSRNLTVQGIA